MHCKQYTSSNFLIIFEFTKAGNYKKIKIKFLLQNSLVEKALIHIKGLEYFSQHTLIISIIRVTFLETFMLYTIDG